MNNNEKFLSLNKSLPQKLLISYSSIFYEAGISENDPLHKLLNEYTEIEKIKEIAKENFTKYLYLNKEYVHNILYDADKTIHIEYNNYLSYNYYLLLLLKDKPDYLNYTFDFGYIKKMIENQKNNEKIFIKLIMLKISLDLIDEYNETHDYNEIKDDLNERKLIDINIYELSSVLSDNYYLEAINIKWTQKDFCSKKVDDIYIEIINNMIKYRKLEEENLFIFEQLDLKNIIINQKMFDEISITLDADEDYIKDYMIKNESDMSDNKKITFYYILFNYILKNHLFIIYENQFLKKTRVNINNMAKGKKQINCKIKDNEELEKKAKCIIEIFTNNGKYYSNRQTKKGNKFKDIFNRSKTNKNSITKNKKLEKIKGLTKSRNSNKNEEKSQIDRSETNGINTDTSKEVSDIDCLIHFYKFLSNNQNNKKLNDYFLNNGYIGENEWYNLFEKSEIKDDKAKKFIRKIINERKIIDIIKKIINERIIKKNNRTNDGIKSLFTHSFYYLGNEEIKDIKKNLPYEINTESIDRLKKWLNEEK